MKKLNKTFKKLATTNLDEKFQSRVLPNLPIKKRRRQSNLDNPLYKSIYGLNELQEQNEEYLEEEEEEDIQDISFELSNLNDMNDLLDNFSNKSDDKVELEFESTTKEEGIQLIEDYLKENTKQIFENKKGLDKEAVNMSKEFYKDLINDLKNNDNDLSKNLIIQRNSTNKSNKDDFNSYNDNYSNNNIMKINDKKRKSYKESKGSYMYSESGTSEDYTPKLKNYFLGQNDTGKMFSLKNKNRSSSKYIIDEEDKE